MKLATSNPSIVGMCEREQDRKSARDQEENILPI